MNGSTAIQRTGSDADEPRRADTDERRSADDRSAAFARRIEQALNGSALVLLVSLGHRLGLFDVMARQGAAGADTLAHAAGLDRRYVRAWLVALAEHEVVVHDPEHDAWWLPPEYAACLCRAHARRGVAGPCQWIPLLGALEEDLLRCFEHGGGIDESRAGRFRALVAEEGERNVSAALLDHIVPAIPGLEDALGRGIDVVDLGCGRGQMLCLLAAAFPASRFTGIDCDPDSVALASAEARARRLANVWLDVRDAESLDAPARFDLVTAFDALRYSARPGRVVAGAARALRPGGRLLIRELATGRSASDEADSAVRPFLYAMACLHCVPLRLSHADDALALPADDAEIRALLADAGFTDVRALRLPHDPCHRYTLARRKG